jgi:ABC-type transport system involved in multi-copper enzyme maturation permease subunit
MVPQLRSLVWKEWHERKWSLALGTTWVMLGAVYALAYERLLGMQAPVASFWGTCTVFGLFAAVFLAMRTSLGEMAHGTLTFSSALPVSLRVQAWVRLGSAVVALVAPIVLGALVMWVALVSGFVQQMAPTTSPGRPDYVPLPQRQLLSALEAGQLVWTVTATTTASSVELLLILSVIGARRRAESHLGFIGVWLAFAWLLLQGLSREVARRFANHDLFDWCGAFLPQTLALSYAYQVGSGKYYGDLSLARWLWLPLAVNLVVLEGLGTWFTRRYEARAIAAEKRTKQLYRRLPAILSRVQMRWPGRWAALAWLDVRQALPMALAGLVLACLMAGAQIVINSGVGRELPLQLAGQLPGSAWIVALLWGAVVGSGMFANEFEPKLEQFWRSRPISASTWFWVKFLAGLAVVLGVLDLVTILVSWESTYARGSDQMSRAYIACMPLLHALMYSLAVLGICWLRRPVLAGMAALLVFFVLSIGLDALPGASWLEPIHVYNAIFFDERMLSGGTFDLAQHGYPVVYGGVAALIVAISVGAWRLALRPS